MKIIADNKVGNNTCAHKIIKYNGDLYNRVLQSSGIVWYTHNCVIVDLEEIYITWFREQKLNRILK